MTTFRYLTVDEWGGRWARPPAAEKLLDGECYVHHTAGALLSNDAAEAFRILNEYAINTKGYSFLDYDVLVHRDPTTGTVTIGEGRGKWMSAATRDRNEQGEAVCLLGYFHPGHKLSRHPHTAELEGVARAIVWAIQQGWCSPDTTIIGHRDNPAHPGATGCPGDYLYAELPTIRDRVSRLLDPSTPNPGEPPMTRRYIMTPASPSAVWMIEGDSRVAVRVTPEAAQRLPGYAVTKIDTDTAMGYLFVNSLEQGVVGLS